VGTSRHRDGGKKVKKGLLSHSDLIHSRENERGLFAEGGMNTSCSSRDNYKRGGGYRSVQESPAEN